jgi:dUTP pyrophosphatase
MPLFVKKIDPKAKVPTVAYENDLCYDLYALEDALVSSTHVTKVRTGIVAVWAVAFNFIRNNKYGLVIRDRSGVSTKHGVFKVAGEVDPGYRGEIIVALTAIPNGLVFQIKAGDKIAQMRPVQLLTDRVEEVDALPEADRGSSGFGSTGR